MFTSIIGLSRGLAVMGYIKIGIKGEKKTSANNIEYRQPKKLDHFEIVTREMDASDNFKTDSEMMRLLGGKPTELDIMLQYDEVDLNFPHFLAAYHGSKLFCRGNGEQALRDGKEIACNPTTCPIFQKQEVKNKLQCKPQGKFNVILPQKNMIGGVYAFKTTSWESIRNIISSLELLSTLTGGILAGLPLKLKLIPTRDQTPTGTTINYKVAVVYQGKPHGLRLHAIEERNLRAVSTIDRKALADARRAEISEGADIVEEAQETVAEFYPVADGTESSVSQNLTGLKPEAKKVEPKPASPIQAAQPVSPVSRKEEPVVPPAPTDSPVQIPVAETPALEPANQISLSGDLQMDIDALFSRLNISESQKKGMRGYHKDRIPDLLKKLIHTAGEKGIKVVEAQP